MEINVEVEEKKKKVPSFFFLFLDSLSPVSSQQLRLSLGLAKAQTDRHTVLEGPRHYVTISPPIHIFWY